MHLLATASQASIDIGTAIGASLGVVCSWQRNRSILWAILHGLLGWFYVIYFALTRKDGERLHSRKPTFQELVRDELRR